MKLFGYDVSLSVWDTKSSVFDYSKWTVGYEKDTCAGYPTFFYWFGPFVLVIHHTTHKLFSGTVQPEET